MATNTPHSPFNKSLGEDDLICMRLPLMWKERQWSALGLGILLWVVTGLAFVVLVPVSLVLNVLSGISSLCLKFRKAAADKLRPKSIGGFNPRPASDIAAMFCRYEKKLMCGKELHTERFALISRMAHMERELEEHRVFSAAISTLRREEAREKEVPKRREAIMHSRLVKKRRAEDERRRREE